MILSLGEALIDLIHSAGQPSPLAKLGGSPFNVATALSRLEVPTGFVCPLSTDQYGDRLRAHLRTHGVHQCIAEPVEAATAIAEVFTNDRGHPTYRFHRDCSADRSVRERPPIEAIPDQLDALHFGSLVLAQADDWPAWRGAIARARQQGAFIAFDPNLRMALIDDFAAYRTRLQEAVELSHLIKASDEDLTLLDPTVKPETTLLQWWAPTRMVVLTEGAKGCRAWISSGDRGHISCSETTHKPIVDTVGAGDTFQAAIIAWLWHNQGFHREISNSEALSMLRFANGAAALNCTKAGCQPPTLAEVRGAVA